jgi:hypothetical protein
MMLRFRVSAAVTVALIAGVSATPGATWVAVPRQEFVALFNGNDLTGWVVENSDGANFSVADGVLRVSGPNGWLRSSRDFGNFTLRAEFRFLTDDADSGLFVRAPGPASNIFIRGWPANAYQVQVRNMATNQTDNPLWIAHVYRHRVATGETRFDREAARSAFRPTGEWQTIEITVVNDVIRVQLNGIDTTVALGIVNPRGFIGIQGEAGRLEYRKIEVRE